jgi:hypothetical protein
MKLSSTGVLMKLPSTGVLTDETSREATSCIRPLFHCRMVGLTYKRRDYCCHDITENRDESCYLISVFPLILTLFGVTNLVQMARK